MIARWLCAILILGCSMASAQNSPIFSYTAIAQPTIANKGMVVAQEDLAATIGRDILRKGGHAVDAAVAVGFALAVTLPRAGNIGGGGFMMIYDAQTHQSFALDYREKAPKSATETLFLGKNGKPDPHLSRHSALSIGVPGTVAGLLAAHQRFGMLPLRTVMTPAIELARKGFLVEHDLAQALEASRKRLIQFSGTQKVFYPGGSLTPAVGTRLKQPDLADTLNEISQKGRAGFYEGKVAAELVAYIQKEGGLITEEDLADYKPKWREPLRGQYRQYEIVSMPPPSSGGVHLIQILQTFEAAEKKKTGWGSATRIHLLAEASKYAYRDRARYLGDTDFVEVPVPRLISKEYARKLATKIKPNKRTPSRDLLDPDQHPIQTESEDTTHFSIVDRYGNAVSNTYTLNYSFGNGRVVPGLGFFLNNEMDDFSAAPGALNAYGLVGSEANKVEPEKRMLSSMTPLFLFEDHKLRLVTGTPGGSRIITTMVQVVQNMTDFNLNVAEATLARRTHHQWWPEQLRVEKGLNADTRERLEAMGYTINEGRAMGSVESIWIEDHKLEGFSDLRKPGGAAVGF